ncbi:MAG: hypothetical protein RML14_06835 [Meiothermus sp.]|uniref:hypothetical protein n=1 Tax=Meiothermus sp. TaxID=1955249 RepID=UPI00298F226F|nr:hypothetical protein [Meiothermus sp.]MDW8481582.1 hypothetical protein [Meiothermus sp.]
MVICGLQTGHGCRVRVQAIARFLKWAHSGEGYFLLGWGRYKTDYTLPNNVPTVNTQIPISVRGSYTQMRWLAFNGNPLEMRGRYPEISVGGRKYVMYQLMAQAQRQGNWIDRTGDLIVKAASNQADLERYVSENLVQFALGQRPINDLSWNQFLSGLRNIRFEQYEAAAEKALRESGYSK